MYECVGRHDKDFLVTAGIKSNGKVSAWITLSLTISALDLILQSRSDLTEYPKQYLKELAAIVERQLANDPQQMVALYKDVDVRYTFLRRAEQELRRMHNIPLIGEGNISETSLHRLLKKHFPDAKHEYSPPWLGKQRFDIYIPSRKIAIEYNGPQHYEPLELFGGEEGFRETRRRDEIKRRLARENGVGIREWPYTRPVNEHEVSILLKEMELVRTGEESEEDAPKKAWKGT